MKKILIALLFLISYSGFGQLVANRIAIVNTATKLKDDPDLFWDPVTNALSSARFICVPTATLPGINVGSFAGDPSAPVNGDLNYNTSLNALRARINGSWVSLGGTGLTNTAAANELMKSDGTNAVPSGVFLNTAPHLQILLGSTADATTDRTIIPQGSSANIVLNLSSKGFSGMNFSGTAFSFNSPLGPRMNIDPANFRVINTKEATDQTVDLKGADGSGTNNDGDGAKITGGDAYNLSGNGVGGDVSLTPGLGFGTGKNGSIKIADGADRNMGVASLVGGTVTVNSSIVTADSRIFLTHENNSGTPGFVTISARTAGTSFTITSSSATDTSTIAWLIVEPQ